ncbi:lactate utilization protein [Chloroflexota bacterium]
MKDETDLSAEREWLYQERARIAVTNLQKKNFNAQYIITQAEALATVLAMIPGGTTVVRDDSVTVDQIGIIPALKKRHQNKVIDPFEWDADGVLVAEVQEERPRMQREAFIADVFLTGTNAITLDGKLVNTDVMGNRVAPMIFGPKKVIIVAGVNKILKDVNEAMERISQVAAPINARRHYLKHHQSKLSDLPCVRTGRCMDCNHKWRICNSTVIIENAFHPNKGRINVVLVAQALGI